jgi:hypothetical protein
MVEEGSEIPNRIGDGNARGTLYLGGGRIRVGFR